ncbi:unnamed protein product, partial [Amoebophrya sp. A25]
SPCIHAHPDHAVSLILIECTTKTTKMKCRYAVRILLCCLPLLFGFNSPAELSDKNNGREGTRTGSTLTSSIGSTSTLGRTSSRKSTRLPARTTSTRRLLGTISGRDRTSFPRPTRTSTATEAPRDMAVPRSLQRLLHPLIRIIWLSLLPKPCTCSSPTKNNDAIQQVDDLQIGPCVPVEQMETLIKGLHGATSAVLKDLAEISRFWPPFLDRSSLLNVLETVKMGDTSLALAEAQLLEKPEDRALLSFAMHLATDWAPGGPKTAIGNTDIALRFEDDTGVDRRGYHDTVLAEGVKGLAQVDVPHKDIMGEEENDDPVGENDDDVGKDDTTGAAGDESRPLLRFLTPAKKSYRVPLLAQEASKKKLQLCFRNSVNPGSWNYLAIAGGAGGAALLWSTILSTCICHLRMRARHLSEELRREERGVGASGCTNDRSLSCSPSDEACTTNETADFMTRNRTAHFCSSQRVSHFLGSGLEVTIGRLEKWAEQLRRQREEDQSRRRLACSSSSGLDRERSFTDIISAKDERRRIPSDSTTRVDVKNTVYARD